MIIVPHHKGKFKTLTISKRTIRLLTGTAAFLFVLFVAFFVDFLTMNGTRQKYKELYKKTLNQSKTIAQYEKSIDKLKATLDQFESYAKKLNVMVGLKSHDILEGELGIGDSQTNEGVGSGTFSQEVDLSNVASLNQKAEGVDKNLNTLVNFFENQALKLAATPSIKPAKGYASSPYGWRSDPFTGKRTFHRGIDFATYFGNPVVSTADGVVIQTTRDKIGGNTIKISHRGGYTTVYCHLSKFLVKPGSRVKRGDTIGLVGQTGKAIGPHVHYEVRLNGKSVNPYYYILEE